jgi:hypothetical protein
MAPLLRTSRNRADEVPICFFGPYFALSEAMILVSKLWAVIIYDCAQQPYRNL